MGNIPNRNLADETVMRNTKVSIPSSESNTTLTIGDRQLHLTNLQKVFWPEDGFTKRDLLQYYADIAPLLLPHLSDRAMVMKRYPNGYAGEFFFMKRTPSPRPSWLQTCSIEHASGNIIDFPMIQDLPALLWVINLGCIDLNQWYARCDDVHRPDYLHFDLDPVDQTAGFDKVLETARIIHHELDNLKIPNFAKTTGSRGIHVYVPLARGPLQKQVWTFAKHFAQALAVKHPSLITSEYRIAKRPKGRVLVDYNQNAWGRTLASVYSVRPRRGAPVSAPVTWQEIEHGLAIEDFRIDNMRARVRDAGDLWKPLLSPIGRLDLTPLLNALNGVDQTAAVVPKARRRRPETIPAVGPALKKRA